MFPHPKQALTHLFKCWLVYNADKFIKLPKCSCVNTRAHVCLPFFFLAGGGGGSGHTVFIPSLRYLMKIIDSGFQVTMMEKDFYLGRILTGRVSSGVVSVGDKVHGLRITDSGTEKIEEGKVCCSIFA